MTQLKYRLLEGGGQAFYEIGVADSGALVGLPRAALDASVETLEAMAGELGASAKEKAERDARWIGDWSDELTVAIALREWDKTVELVEDAPVST